jgi:phosphopantetheinyl transferase (holo-ACP synthase)
MIGNDIICIERWRSQFTRRQAQKTKRLFTPVEREVIQGSADPVLAAGVHWALKETAYKFFHRMNLHREFAPRSMDVRIDDKERTAVVSTKYGSVSCAVSVTASCIYASTQYGRSIEAMIEKSGSGRQELQQMALQKANGRLAQIEDIGSPGIRVLKVGTLPFYADQQNIARPMSISHDGAFYAVALLLDHRISCRQHKRVIQSMQDDQRYC